MRDASTWRFGTGRTYNLLTASLLGSVSKMMMDRFFNCLQQKATEL